MKKFKFGDKVRLNDEHSFYNGLVGIVADANQIAGLCRVEFEYMERLYMEWIVCALLTKINDFKIDDVVYDDKNVSYKVVGYGYNGDSIAVRNGLNNNVKFVSPDDIRKRF